MDVLEFLDLEEMLEIHALQLDELGGIAGVRDRDCSSRLVKEPRATAFGELLHADLFEMAAADLCHIVKNHAFSDGNKARRRWLGRCASSVALILREGANPASGLR